MQEPVSANVAPSDQAVLARLDELAQLPPLEYEKIRKAEAKRLGIRTPVLDEEVKARRSPSEDVLSGSPLTFPDIEPWDDSVDGAVLLDDVSAVIRRHVSLSLHAAHASALWITWSWLLDRFDIAPRLAILSPEKRCGKTTLLELLHALVPRALLASSITPAVIFRMIEAAHPTLLIDEADTFAPGNEELRGILNSGHTKAGASVARCVGDDHIPRRFSTWCPMALAAIGSLPGTVEDRAIIVRMQRKAPGTAVAPFPRSGKRAAALKHELHRVARKVCRWTDDHGKGLAELDPAVPGDLHDRAADNWRPLLAIADCVGGDWPTRARDAATALSGSGAEARESMGVQLLADIKVLAERDGWEKIKSLTLCTSLAGLEERPWSEWRNGQPITPTQLAWLLRPFGISSRNVRLEDGSTPKGYFREDFTEALGRYVPEGALSSRHTATSGSSSGDAPLFQAATPPPCGGSEHARNPAPAADCGGVAAQNPPIGAGEEILEI